MKVCPFLALGVSPDQLKWEPENFRCIEERCMLWSGCCSLNKQSLKTGGIMKNKVIRQGKKEDVGKLVYAVRNLADVWVESIIGKHDGKEVIIETEGGEKITIEEASKIIYDFGKDWDIRVVFVSTDAKVVDELGTGKAFRQKRDKEKERREKPTVIKRGSFIIVSRKPIKYPLKTPL